MAPNLRRATGVGDAACEWRHGFERTENLAYNFGRKFKLSCCMQSRVNRNSEGWRYDDMQAPGERQRNARASQRHPLVDPSHEHCMH